MFARPRPKKGLGPPPSKKRRNESAIEEINFDFDARQEYLTGFHKRKLQRAKLAQEQAAKKAREEKLETRKQLREERKQQLEEHVNAISEALRPHSVGVDGETSEDDDAWNGIADEPAPEPIDREEEYVDEDRYTLVTVEDIDVDKEGIHKVADSDDEEEEAAAKAKAAAAAARAKEEAEKSKKKVWPKKKKVKFRYESKEERKFTRAKQKANRKEKADKRRKK